MGTKQEWGRAGLPAGRSDREWLSIERQSSEAVATAHMASLRMRWSASSILLRVEDSLGLADERGRSLATLSAV